MEIGTKKMTEQPAKERERRLRRADREKYISEKQAETLLKREIRKMMGKVKARCVCVWHARAHVSAVL